jgi:hypothetical protein
MPRWYSLGEQHGLDGLLVAEAGVVGADRDRERFVRAHAGTRKGEVNAVEFAG